ncbi:hypothetical protein BDR07DRAFT_218167 [Suillus spraguei]|nr:hypothetical protein BDR07DRAFT_218167 [Suillus spraguei]
MTASSKPTEESWHPSNLLAHDTLPNHQDFESMISDAKFTANTRTDFYDSSLTSRKWALVGVACSIIFSCSCIVAGIVIVANGGAFGVAVTKLINAPFSQSWPPQPSAQISLQMEILTLVLNLIVTLCTESIGFVHSISLRSALASESRLRFNTNLRLLTAARERFNPNGTLVNSILAVLIIFYGSASLVVGYDVYLDSDFNVNLSQQGISFVGLPLLILGVGLALLLQAMIALLGIRAVKILILTWRRR